MPSHLTRHIIQRILANEPILHRECVRRRAYRTTRLAADGFRRQRVSNGTVQQQRTFLNFNMFGGKKKRDAREANLDPGIETMMFYSKMERLRARLPPVEEVEEALEKFFNAKSKQKQGIEDTHAQLALQSLRYVQDTKSRLPAQASTAERQIMKRINTMLKHAMVPISATKNPAASHVELANEAYQFLLRTGSNKNSSLIKRALRSYVQMLGRTGQSLIARNVVLAYERQLSSHTKSRGQSELPDEADLEEESPDQDSPTAQQQSGNRYLLVDVWAQVLEGIAAGDSEVELLKTLDMLRERGFAGGAKVSLAMLDFYLRGKNKDAVKAWFLRAWEQLPERHDLPNTPGHGIAYSLRQTLRWCLVNKELELGHHIVSQTMASNPPKVIWDAIFMWAAGTGKGADEIGRMFAVMESQNKGISNREEWRIPDINTINTLVEYATSRDDPYLAERFISLGKERNIQPDAGTYVLQMAYRLKVNDVDGALVAYTNLQTMDLSSNKDVPASNKLLTALCNSKRHDFETIMNVVADMSDRKVRFEPPTVTALSLLHLNRDEVSDVIDLLNTHSYHFSSTEREAIRSEIVHYCIDPATTTPRSWDAYTILNSIFDEMPRQQRTDIMTSFFNRQRPDMAVYVFQNMRAHSRADTIPTVDTYVAAFLSSAKLEDAESLIVVHNQMKLDFNVDATTYLYNALMIAYTACGKPRRALDFWDDIVASREGPSYNSIHIALRACEKAPFGDLKAQEIWAMLRKQNVDLDQGLWSSYAAALAGNGDNELAIKTVEEAGDKDEVEVDAFLLGSLFNSAAGQDKQAELEAWAQERYAAAWSALKKTPMEEREDGMRSFKIDRSVTP